MFSIFFNCELMLQKTELLIVINFLVDCMLVSFKDPHSYSEILKKKNPCGRNFWNSVIRDFHWFCLCPMWNVSIAVLFRFWVVTSYTLILACAVFSGRFELHYSSEILTEAANTLLCSSADGLFCCSIWISCCKMLMNFPVF